LNKALDKIKSLEEALGTEERSKEMVPDTPNDKKVEVSFQQFIPVVMHQMNQSFDKY